MADLGFPRGGGVNPQGGSANLLFGQKFPENCMKMKEFGPKGGAHVPGTPLRSANEYYCSFTLCNFLLIATTIYFAYCGLDRCRGVINKTKAGGLLLVRVYCIKHVRLVGVLLSNCVWQTGVCLIYSVLTQGQGHTV